MHCHLLVPDFFAVDEALTASRRLQAAETLIARGRRSRLPGALPEAWLCQQFGLEQQRDWPVAPYSLLADGGAPDGYYWLRADPVHYRLTRDQALLADTGVFEISREEAETLVEVLNRHFGERLTLFPLQPGRWYARLPAAPALHTVPLPDARGKSVTGNLPSGADAMAFHVLMNEAQMLLFEHPVNVAREARGALPINSVWFWGGGTYHAGLASRFSVLATDEPLARGLAQAANVTVRNRPRSAAEWLKQAPDSGLALVLLDTLRSAASYGDNAALEENRLALERDWFAPLLQALRDGTIGMLTLHLYGPDFVLKSETAKSDLRYFWRRPRPLAAYAEAKNL
jgi:hypothetical protein